MIAHTPCVSHKKNALTRIYHVLFKCKFKFVCYGLNKFFLALYVPQVNFGGPPKLKKVPSSNSKILRCVAFQALGLKSPLALELKVLKQEGSSYVGGPSSGNAYCSLMHILY